MVILRWFLSRTVRQAFDLCRQVRRILNAQRDLLPQLAVEEVVSAMHGFRRSAATVSDRTAIRAGMADFEKVANEHLKPYPHAGWRENVEVLLVTGVVVMALRTFFFQPMAIPSGSAQPTLWGITHENLKVAARAEIPRGVRRWVDACWRGTRYYHVTAENPGTLRTVEDPKMVFPFVKRQRIWLGNTPYTIWFPPDDLAGRAGLREGQSFRAGEDIVKLKVISGDHLFVDRLTYNFRRPLRGEIVVFASQGIPGLIENTHYIKRLVALGGEHVRVGNDRHLIIDGQRLDASTPHFENIYSFNPKRPPRVDQYSGHVNGHVASRYTPTDLAPRFHTDRDEFVVRPRHYLAFGDNTMNSHDGRNWGDFPEEKVVGRAGFVFWPITSRFGWGYR